jgi:hypothetical protein
MTMTDSPSIAPADPWLTWRKLLAGQDTPIHADDPQSGYYRDGDRPVAIWISEKTGDLICWISNKPVDIDAAKERWQFICKRPVSFEDYTVRMTQGNWPGENAVVTRSNNAPADDTLEGVMAQIEELAHEAERLMKLGAAKTQVQANEASDVAERLSKLYAKAETARKAEKQPHLDKEREIDDKWRPVTAAASIYKRLRDLVVEPFLKAQKRAKEEAERKAREEADAARRAATQKEEAARRAADEAVRQGNASAAAAAKKAQDEADAAAATANTAEATAMTVSATPITAGSRGRKTHLATVTIVTIEDRAKVLAFFNDRQELTDLLQSLAEKAVKAGFTVPGTKVTKDQDAR